MKLDVFTTGGTIDKIYFDKKSEFAVGDPVVGSLLESMGVTFEFTVNQLMRLDSLDMTDEDRAIIYAGVSAANSSHVLITHGTDGMAETAAKLTAIQNKTIVLTGSLQPAAFAHNDAVFNIGCAVGAIQSLPPGVYVAMSGRIFAAKNVVKNTAENRFEAIAEKH
ncbi:MAG: asparaginase domain-containing protein [Pseudomonadales bacterium]|jgi:L-asparaginase|tara:strand:- start:183 stop:677 length:495 start_codon:yes stop_codon:yes gene_type:complete